MKQCKTCKEYKATTDFYKAVCKSGLSANCKICLNKREKELRSTPTTKKARSEYLKKYRTENPERMKKLYKRAKKKRTESGQDAEWARQRRACKISSSDGTVTIDALANLLTHQNNNCYYCGSTLDTDKHLDHYIPLSKGGTHSINNVVWSCPKCNLTKNATLPWNSFPVRNWKIDDKSHIISSLK